MTGISEEGKRPGEGAAHELTTVHVRRARGGDLESQGWLIERFTPILLTHAKHRMGPLLLARVEPEDVVQDVWALALPRLPELTERDGRHTPVVMRFLATAILNRINNLLRLRMTDEHADAPLSAIPEATRGPLTRAIRQEHRWLVHEAIEGLGERDRELVLLRALEQHSNAAVAEQLNLDPNTAAQAYRRALIKLREKLPGTAFDELGD